MASIREPAVAGLFYDGNRQRLEQTVQRMLAGGAACMARPRALIAPHAGHVYSGPIAANAYAQWSQASSWRRILLLGPSHRVPFRGMALPSVDTFRTPLGDIPIDRDACTDLCALPQVGISDLPHAQEHSLEVHLPFLQQLLEDFLLIPVVVGAASAAEVAALIERYWDDPETGILISSDLSHFHPYDEARRIDAATSRRIEQRATDLRGEEACGHLPINGLLAVAGRHGLDVTTLDLRNSGDTAGDRSRVVGYGAYAIH